MKARYTPRAVADIGEIADYIRQFSPGSAGKVREEILRAIGLLEKFPSSGPRTAVEEVRRVVVRRYLGAQGQHYRVGDRRVSELRDARCALQQCHRDSVLEMARRNGFAEPRVIGGAMNGRAAFLYFYDSSRQGSYTFAMFVADYHNWFGIAYGGRFCHLIDDRTTLPPSRPKVRRCDGARAPRRWHRRRPRRRGRSSARKERARA